jgi:hypothetical protein
LIRKLAECLDGVDVSHYHVGDVLDLPSHKAEMVQAQVNPWVLPPFAADSYRIKVEI